MSPHSTHHDTTNLFHRTDYNEAYWTDYLAARPEYSQEFYQSIYAFHRAHDGEFTVAHDIGTGPGQVAAELSKHFSRVIATDNNKSHLSIAQHRLGGLCNTDDPSQPAHVQLTQCTAEDLAATFPPNSADLITAAECIPLLDVDAALQSFHTVLKPHGTLALWFYGRPIFAEPSHAPQCRRIYDAIVDKLYAPVIQGGGGPQHKTGWTRATQTLLSFLDNVDMTTSGLWADVHRIKWNAEHEMCFYTPAACDFDVARVSNVDNQKESVVEVRDLAFWESEWDVHGVRRFVTALMPQFGNEEFRVQGIEELYGELARVMGGEGAVRKITWPVVLILASKR